MKIRFLILLLLIPSIAVAQQSSRVHLKSRLARERPRRRCDEGGQGEPADRTTGGIGQDGEIAHHGADLERRGLHCRVRQ